MTRSALILAACTLLALAACGGTEDPDQENTDPSRDAESGLRLDAGSQNEDATITTPDAGEAPADATTPAPDAELTDTGTDRPDTGTGPSDTGTIDTGTPQNPDAGIPPPDAGTPPPDAGDPAPAILNPGWIGGPCTADTDCPYAGGFCLRNSDGWPAGTCSQDCAQFCPDQTGPLNSVTFCIDDGNGDADGSCVSRCDYTLSPTGCRSGYVCLPEKRFSQPSVVRHACVPTAGVPGRAPPVFDIGEACTTASDCNRNTCITDLPGGYCTQESCDVVGCPTGSTCFSLGLENYHVCLRDCVTSTECRQSEGYACDTDNTCWYVPPPAGACNLAGAATDCANYAAMASTDFVVVTKSLRRIAHCNGPTLVGSYCAGLGTNAVDDKEREGDRRTPEGIFYIPRRIPASMYYKAFLISYPDSADAARGLAAGLITQSEHDAIVAAQNARTEPPQHTNLGGLIEIHGGGSGSDWTWGCIATENSNIDLMWATISAGDTVVILH